VARTLRSFSALDQTVLIAVTAHSEDPYIDEAAQSGFDYFICKPVEANFLLECAYASKPEAMLVLSETLLQRNRVSQDQSDTLSQRSRAIREKSRQIIEAMLHRIARYG
jgi:CheY-like chemotaxis protein